MAKRITNKDRIKEIFLNADETESHVLLEMASLIVEMRHQGTATAPEKPKRGRPAAKQKPSAEPAGEKAATSSPLT